MRGKSIRHLFVVNNGKHNFNFVWTLRQYGLVIAGGQHESNPVEETREDSNTALSNKRAVVSISPENGSVQSGTRKRCVLTFQPKKLGSIPVAELSLQVTCFYQTFCFLFLKLHNYFFIIFTLRLFILTGTRWSYLFVSRDWSWCQPGLRILVRTYQLRSLFYIQSWHAD